MIEFAKICRLCISDTSSTTNVLSVDDDSVTFCDKLITVCNIQTSAGDCLPTALCVQCQEKLRQFYEFKLMCLHSNVLLNRFKKDLTNSSTILSELRKKIEPVFSNVEVKQEVDRTNDNAESSENILEYTKTNSFTDSIDNESQNVIPLRKSRDDDRFSDNDDDYRSYDNFADGSLELNVEEVEEILINLGNNKHESSTTDSTTADKSSSSNKEVKFKTVIIQETKSGEFLLVDEYDDENNKDDDKSATKSTGHKCKDCGKIFAKEAGLRQHILRYSGKQFKCEVCDRIFTEKSNLYNHRRTHSDARPYQCHICGKTFKFASCRRSHLQRHSTDKPFVCNICGKAFTQKVALKAHVIIHTGEKPYKCTICNKGFAHPTGLRGHRFIHTTDRPFQCDICFLDFKHEKGMKGHRKLHSRTGDEVTERNFSCEKCGKAFKEKGSLKKHSAIHSDERPYKCDLCGKTFKLRSCWRSHKISHEGKKVVCNICGKKYLNNNVLMNHMRVHTGEKPYKCDLCAKCFTDNSTLRSHKISHSNIKEQKCEYCGLEFKHRSYLMFHIKAKHVDVVKQSEGDQQQAVSSTTAGGERPFKCDLCENCFADNASLQLHKMSHSNVRNEKCEYCGVEFKGKYHLARHISTKHEGRVKPAIVQQKSEATGAVNPSTTSSATTVVSKLQVTTPALKKNLTLSPPPLHYLK